MQKERTLVALLHCYSWACPFNEIDLAPGISICRLEGSPIEACYKQLCETKGIDDGEPFQYEVFLSISEPQTEFFSDTSDPLSLLSRICNIMTVISGVPVGMCRTLSFLDRDSLPHSELAFALTGQTEFLQPPWASVTPSMARELIQAWNNVQREWEENKSKGRIANALLFLYSAWRSHYIEHICLNLAVCLEMLFAPHANVETTHQIAFNFSRFVSSDPKDRESMFNLCKKFYGVRSAIIHGAIPDDKTVIDATVKMFPLIVGTTKTLILDEQLIRCFDSETDRKALFKKYLFS